MSVLILATSGSGKSWAAQYAYAPKSAIRCIDGDDVISAHKLWPKDKLWWQHLDGEQKHALHLSHARVILGVLNDNPDTICVWWTKVDVIMEEYRKGIYADVEPFKGVVVSHAQLHSNWMKREQAIKNGESGHASRTWESYKSGLEKSVKEFQANGIKTWPSLREALLSAGAYIRTKTASL